MQASEAVQWKMDEWEIPPPLPRVKTSANLSVCPYVGLKLPHYAREKHLKKAWFSKREVYSWEIQPFRRRALYKLLKRNFNSWIDWLRIDSTPTFYKDMEGFKKRQSGAVIGIAGPKMSGKSRLGQMLLTRLVDTQPHVLFQYKDLESHVRDRNDLSLAIQIDEDLKATGNESRNLVIHVNNSFETSRKADLWAICTGVNLNFKDWGNTLDLRMVPFGFNVEFQATRAAVFDKENDFLGFCVFQRKHLPEDPVFYYNANGFWGEYEARARAYSLTVTKKGGVQDAVDDITQTEHIETLKKYFEKYYIDKGIPLPKDLMCRRLYRRAQIPAKSVGYMNEVIAWAIAELDENSKLKPVFIPISTKGWYSLRKTLHTWLVRHNIRSKTAWYLADWHVYKGLKQDKIGAQYNIGRDAVQAAIGRHKDVFVGYESELGILTERWFALHTDSLEARVGTGHRDSPDVLLLIDGTVVAVNVKLNLEKTYRRDYTTTPENKWKHAVLAVVHARIPVIRLYPLKGPSTYAHWEKGVPCAPEELADKLREMIVSG